MKTNRELLWYLVGAVLGMIALALILERRKRQGKPEPDTWGGW